MDLGPGDLVEAVNDAILYGVTVIATRSIYTVEEVCSADQLTPHSCQHGPQCRAGGVRIVGVPIPKHLWICERTFRPIGRPAQGLINSINQWIAEGAPLKEGEIA